MLEDLVHRRAHTEMQGLLTEARRFASLTIWPAGPRSAFALRDEGFTLSFEGAAQRSPHLGCTRDRMPQRWHGLDFAFVDQRTPANIKIRTLENRKDAAAHICSAESLPHPPTQGVSMGLRASQA